MFNLGENQLHSTPRSTRQRKPTSTIKRSSDSFVMPNSTATCASSGNVELEPVPSFDSPTRTTFARFLVASKSRRRTIPSLAPRIILLKLEIALLSLAKVHPLLDPPSPLSRLVYTTSLYMPPFSVCASVLSVVEFVQSPFYIVRYFLIVPL